MIKVRKVKTTYINTLLMILLIGISFLALPNVRAFAATEPSIVINSPTQNAELNNVNVIVSGTYTAENIDFSDLTFTAYEINEDNSSDVISDSIDQAIDWNIFENETDGSGTWSFSKTLVGTQNLTFEIKAPENIGSALISFTVKENPHGNYVLTSPDGQPIEDRTYLCANCHSTHNGSNVVLEGGSYQNLASDSSSNYCMACHDGTTASRVENMDSKIESKHDTEKMTTHETNSGTCTACHNPHLKVTAENPNILKDHFVYNDIDSLESTCDSCHKGDTITGPSDYHQNAVNRVLSYNKYPTPNDQGESYSLCLRCHYGGKATDIKRFYLFEEKTEKSGHFLTSADGTLLGQIPCAQCHETHRAKNLLLLKNILGETNQTEFTFTSGSWDGKTEWDFCLTCHNNSTAIFNITGRFNSELPEHQETNKDLGCSSCHGSDSLGVDKFLSAAHAPKIIRKEIELPSETPSVGPEQNPTMTEESTPETGATPTDLGSTENGTVDSSAEPSPLTTETSLPTENTNP